MAFYNPYKKRALDLGRAPCDDRAETAGECLSQGAPRTDGHWLSEARKRQGRSLRRASERT